MLKDMTTELDQLREQLTACQKKVGELETENGELKATIRGLHSEIDKSLEQLSAAQGENEALKAVHDAAGRLVTRLEAIHENSEYQSVWTVAQAHRGPYSGPQYEQELKTIKSLLSKPPTGEAG